MRRTGELKNFRALAGPHAYNARVHLWDGDATTGWVFPTNTSFQAWPTSEDPQGYMSKVVVSRVPFGHIELDPGRGAPIPIQEDVQSRATDERQIAWTMFGYTGVDTCSDADIIMVNDIFISRVISEDTGTVQDDSANCLFELERVVLTQKEAEFVAARQLQLGIDSRLGKFTRNAARPN
jgi:hypothetical protein|tara:strand:+ start:580 stop:1119 length:540 start_codon:yes stop_codon:yes gene_type:complete